MIHHLHAQAKLDPCAAIEAWARRQPVAMARWGPKGRWTLVGRAGEVVRPASGSLLPACPQNGRTGGGWIGIINYGACEACAGAWPAAIWRRIDAPCIYDSATGVWSGSGDLPLEEAGETQASIGDLRLLDGRERYIANVARAIEHICAGDIYQANIAHRLGTSFAGSARTLFGALLRESRASCGVYLEWDELGGRRAVLSASPESFLEYDPRIGRVVTRPMKGTGPAGSLLDSQKDRAELNMIVDLARNDLGRVCRFGSVRIEAARTIEECGRGPGALAQGVAHVAGVVREGVGHEELLRATFPAGSITGAPKISAMRIIDELEGFDRGAFCGTMGWLGDDGDLRLNVAIRTATIAGAPGDGEGDFEDGELVYPVGAGIVSDSRPEAEWAETLAKAGVLRASAKRLGGTRLECAPIQAVALPSRSPTIMQTIASAPMPPTTAM